MMHITCPCPSRPKRGLLVSPCCRGDRPVARYNARMCGSRSSPDARSGEAIRPPRSASRPDVVASAATMSDEGADQKSRERWAELAREIERLNLQDPHAGAARARSVAGRGDRRSRAGHGRCRRRRTRSASPASTSAREPRVRRGRGRVRRARPRRRRCAMTRIGHVEALRYLGRYDEAIALAQGNLAYLRSRGERSGWTWPPDRQPRAGATGGAAIWNRRSQLLQRARGPTANGLAREFAATCRDEHRAGAEPPRAVRRVAGSGRFAAARVPRASGRGSGWPRSR